VESRIYTSREGVANRLALMIEVKKKKTCTNRDGSASGQE
jgi:hypothetical protein